MRLFLFALLVLFALPVRAGDLTFEKLKGEWSGPGSFQGRPSTVTDRFEPLYGGQYWRLHSRTEFTEKDGRSAEFTGEGTYAAGATPMWGSWIDTTGDATVLQPSFSGDTLTVKWGPPGGAPEGESTYKLNADGTITVTDSFDDSGTMTLFARATLTRQK